MIVYIEPNLYKELYSICKLKMASKSFNKWKDYCTEIKPEYLAKLEQFVTIDNYEEGKKSRAFRLMKNGNNTGIFTKINDVNIQQNE